MVYYKFIYSKIDRLLRPTKLKVHHEEAKQIYNYWLKTCDECLTAVVAAPEDAEIAYKLEHLTNFHIYRILAIISDATTSAEVQTALDNAYRKKNKQYIGRSVANAQNQNPNDSITEYVYALYQFAMHCNFQDINAVAYRNELTKDAFKTALVHPECDKGCLNTLLWLQLKCWVEP